MDEDTDYLLQHNIAGIFECFLTGIVPNKHPFPEEVISQSFGLIARLPPVEHERQLSSLIQSFQRARQEKAHFEQINTSLQSLSFDVFSLNVDGHDLLIHIFVMFDALHLIDRCAMDLRIFGNWLLTVKQNYHPKNPFHNFLHAFNVLQTLYVFLHANAEFWVDGVSVFSEVELLSMCVGALCHDLQHPGVNNTFLIMTEHPLAMRYNDASVLEQHHASTTFAVLESGKFLMRLPAKGTMRSTGPSQVPQCDITAAYFTKGTSDPRRQQFRKLVVRFILATDVTKHKHHIDVFRQQFSAAGVSFNLRDCEAREALMTALMLAADISNEIRSFDFSRKWAPLVCEEFCQQGDVMLATGLWHQSGGEGQIVPAMFRRGTAQPSADQPGFINFLCLPLFEAISEVLPWFSTCVAQLKSNALNWSAKY